MKIRVGKSKKSNGKKLISSIVADLPLEDLEIGGTEYKTTYTSKFRKRQAFVAPDPRRILSAIPGKIIKVLVKKGQKINAGDPVVILEAMKMMNQIAALHDGVIKSVNVREGETIPKKYLLVEME
jgi:pyruvate carboxylase